MLQDIPFFEDLLRSGHGEKGVLMINSPGGSGEAAEKILLMCRKRFTKSFKVIVPDFAKSAATMIALGADQILMGYLSELGPIDPQFMTSPMGPGIPARSLIDGLEIIREKVKGGDPIQLYYPMLSQIRPELIARAQSAIDESREFAEKWLKQYQLKDDPKQAKQVAEWLSASDKVKKYKSHGKVLNVDECLNELHLKVESLPNDSELWNAVWELYGRSVFFLQSQPLAAKLFENDKVSLTINISVQQTPIQTPQQVEAPVQPQ
jgi:membrane-bound ClpP family serine protease